jgi:hypothetical protein
MADQAIDTKPDFFVSYTAADQSWAEWIAYTLEANGYSCVIQAWDFRPGSNFVVEMQRAASQAERTIAALSPTYLQKSYPAPEWAAAFADDPEGLRRKLVPVRVEECRPEGLLRGIVYIDLVGLDEAAAVEALLRGVVPGRAKPATSPTFPGAGARAASVQAPPFPGNHSHADCNSIGRTGRTEAPMDQAAALLVALRAAAGLGDGRLEPARVEALAGALGVGKEELPALAARWQEAK